MATVDRSGAPSWCLHSSPSTWLTPGQPQEAGEREALEVVVKWDKSLWINVPASHLSQRLFRRTCHVASRVSLAELSLVVHTEDLFHSTPFVGFSNCTPHFAIPSLLFPHLPLKIHLRMCFMNITGCHFPRDNCSYGVMCVHVGHFSIHTRVYNEGSSVPRATAGYQSAACWELGCIAEGEQQARDGSFRVFRAAPVAPSPPELRLLSDLGGIRFS